MNEWGFSDPLLTQPFCACFEAININESKTDIHLKNLHLPSFHIKISPCNYVIHIQYLCVHVVPTPSLTLFIYLRKNPSEYLDEKRRTISVFCLWYSSSCSKMVMGDRRIPEEHWNCWWMNPDMACKFCQL